MRSRFSSGLLVDVQPPDLETRIAILHKKADAEGLEVTPEVFEYVASRISSNIRELEGALVRIGAWASLYQERIDLNLAQMMLKDFVSNPDDNEITRQPHHEPVRRLLRRHHRTDGILRAQPQRRRSPPDRHVSVSRTHRPVAAQDRTGLRARPHDGHARQQEDLQAHEGKARNLQPRVRAYKPHQTEGQRVVKAARALTIVGARAQFTGVVHRRCTNGLELWRKSVLLWISKSCHLLRAQDHVTIPQPRPRMTTQRFD